VLTHLLLEFGATAILNDHGANFSASLQLTCQLLMPSLAEVRFKHGEQSRRE
jgi:hypothetical protein